MAQVFFRQSSGAFERNDFDFGLWVPACAGTTSIKPFLWCSSLLADQSFYKKDLAQLEAEWLELQEQLEGLAA